MIAWGLLYPPIFSVLVTMWRAEMGLKSRRDLSGALLDDRRLALTIHGVMTTEEAPERARRVLVDAAMAGDPQGVKGSTGASNRDWAVGNRHHTGRTSGAS